jgi:Zn-dependent protease with chaperone function
MKRLSRMFFFAFFCLTYLTLGMELLQEARLGFSLGRGETGLPPDSKTAKMASGDRGYIASQRAALRRGFEAVMGMLLETSVYMLAAALFLVDAGRRFSVKFSEKSFGMLFGLEMSIISCFIALYSVGFCSEYIIKVHAKDAPLGLQLLYCFAFMALGVPTVACFCIRLLRAYGVRFILACYISFFIYQLLDVFTGNEVDLGRMEKMSPDVFSEKIRGLLKRQGLSDSVYRETTPGEESNAALVGIGKKERIEIYGSINDLSMDSIESVMMHEIGHSVYESLLRKISVYLFLVYLEMLVLVFIYTKVSGLYACDTISRDGSFLILAALYQVLIRPWFFVFYNLTSHMAEISSDMFTKEYGYGAILQRILYRITIDSRDLICSNWLFNVYTKMHPNIYSRIEYLNE